MPQCGLFQNAFETCSSNSNVVVVVAVAVVAVVVVVVAVVAVFDAAAAIKDENRTAENF